MIRGTEQLDVDAFTVKDANGVDHHRLSVESARECLKVSGI